MTFGKSIAVAWVALTLSASALAQTEKVGPLSISQPWTRATPPKAQTAGGFLTIENSGEEPDRLVGASSPVARRVEIHQMRMDNGVMMMRPATGGIEIPAGGAAILAPGGFHIMFTQLKESLVEGETIPVVLSFERAGDMKVLFAVEAIGASAPATTSDDGVDMHGTMDHGQGQNQ